MTRPARPAARVPAYAVALAVVLAAAALRAWLFGEMGHLAPLSSYYAAVMVAGWYGGLGARRPAPPGGMAARVPFSPTQAGLDLDRVARAIVERLADAVGDLCILRLLTADGTTLTPVAFHHRSAEARAILLDALRPVPSNSGLIGTA